jgi:hypothetical protein
MNLWPGLHVTRNELSSKRCAEQHRDGVFRHSHVRGYFDSTKNGRSVYYASSYELRCLFLLEADVDVVAFWRCDVFKGSEGWRNPDLWVEFLNGRSEVWEVKPEGMLLFPAVVAQIEESKAFAMDRGVGFRVWTEADSGLETDHGIVKWATEYIASVGEVGASEHHREVRRRIRERHYKKTQQDRVQVSCEFCGETHDIMRLAYDRNVKKNGRFICIRENGNIIGKRSKVHLKKTNPYASEGKKRCSTCREVKPFEAFDVRRASWDGWAPRCKVCSKERRMTSKTEKTS